MKKILFSILVFSAMSANAQNPIYQSSLSHFADLDSQCKIKKIKVDAAGNQYIAGSYYGDVDLDPGTGTINVTSPSTQYTNRYFFQKLSPSGVVIWTISDFEYDIADIAFNSSGELFGLAFFSATTAGDVVDIDPTAATVNVTSIGLVDAMLVRIDASGTILSASLYGLETENEYPKNIEIDQNDNIYILNDATNVGGAFYYAMILKRSSTGAAIWQKNLSGPGKASSSGLQVDASGNVYVSGRFLNSIDFDPNAGDQTSTTAASNVWDKYVVKLSSTGTFVWKNIVAGSFNNLVPTDLALDSQGNSYCVGYQRSSTIEYGGVGQSPLTVTLLSILHRTFIHKLDANGVHAWARFQNDTIYGEQDNILVEVDPTDNAIVFSYGRFQTNNAQRNFVTGIAPSGTNLFEMYEPLSGDNFCMTLAPNNDLFLAGLIYTELSFNNGANSILADQSSYLLRYSQCSNNTATTLSGTTITSSQNTGTYQWLDCATNSQIAGATNKTFTPTVSGNYAVIVNNGTCADTSACVTVSVTTTGVIENAADLISIYPNPTMGLVTISSPQAGSTLQLVDASGRVLRTEIVLTEQITLDLSAHQNGIYFIHLKDVQGNTSTKKLIVRK